MTTLQAQLGNFVKKSGDTMTGQLTYKMNTTPIVHNNSALGTSNPSESKFSGFLARSSEGKNFGWFQPWVNASGNANTQLGASNAWAGGTVNNTLLLTVSRDGTRSVDTSENAPWRRALNCGWARLCGMSSNMTLTTTATRIPYVTFNYFNTNWVTFTKNGDGIKVDKGCNVGIQAAMYVYTGYTASDLVHIAIYRNTERILDVPFRAPTANPYMVISTPIMYSTLSANDTIYAVAWNQMASRGTVANAVSVGLYMWVI